MTLVSDLCGPCFVAAVSLRLLRQSKDKHKTKAWLAERLSLSLFLFSSCWTVVALRTRGTKLDKKIKPGNRIQVERRHRNCSLPRCSPHNFLFNLPTVVLQPQWRSATTSLTSDHSPSCSAHLTTSSTSTILPEAGWLRVMT